ncbi:MAG TPA: hypothetical protein VH590_06690 [Ktedonobacterales bacterium]
MTSPSPAPDDKTPVATGVITRPPSAVGRRRNLLPNLALAGVIGALVLVFALWLGGGRLGLFPDTSNQPMLTITSSGPYIVGGSVTLRGERFSPNSLIAILRDGEPAADAQGLRQAVETDPKGSFTITLPITADWQSGEHVLSARDTTSQQRASVSIQIGT